MASASRQPSSKPARIPLRFASVLLLALLLLAITLAFLHLCKPSAHVSALAFPFFRNLTSVDNRHTSPAASASPTNSSQPPSAPATSPPDLCLLVGTDPAQSSLWQHNSRALCVVTSFCLPNNISSTIYRVAPTSPPICRIRTATFLPHSRNLSSDFFHEFHNCTSFHRRYISCAYGTGYGLNRPICPHEQLLPPVSQFTADNRTVRWYDDLTILVPDYPYQRNIFHYSAILPYVALVLSRLSTILTDWHRTADVQALPLGSVYEPASRVVNVVFRGKLNRNGWQRGLYHAVFTHMMPQLGYDMRVQFLEELPRGDVTCLRNAVQLGFFGDINVWPFANDTSIAPNGRSVPVTAVQLKDAVYRAAGVPAVRVESSDGKERFRIPPLVVGYARRMGEADLADVVGDNVKAVSAARVFTREDEAWFAHMLREEVEARGVELREFTTKNTESFEEQIRNVVGLGVVVGIHGANLVNAMFARPFAGVVEIFPFGEHSRCYYAGMNSGMAYWGLEATESAGGFRCDERVLECRLRYRNLEVCLGEGGDRERLRGLVREAVAYLKGLHENHEGGVPVALDESAGQYVVSSGDTALSLATSQVGVWF